MFLVDILLINIEIDKKVYRVWVFCADIYLANAQPSLNSTYNSMITANTEHRSGF